MELVARRRWEGWLVGLVNQACWALLIWQRELWGLAPLCAVLTWRYAVALYRWRMERSMDDPKYQGIEATCGACHRTQMIYTPDFDEISAQQLAGIMDGTSPLYVKRPGEESAIGRCESCGGRFTCTLFGYGAPPAAP